MSYNVATFTRLEQNADGSVAMIITHTGDSGELPREQRIPYEAITTPTADTVRAFAIARNGILNRTKNFVTGATPNIGSTLDITTPLPTVTSTFGAFVAASAPFTPGATPQDVFTITGSATRNVQITKIAITTVQTTSGLNAWALVKRSTANSAGTSAAVTRVPLDRAFPAATATVLQYTANPTAGTLVGNVWSGRVAAPALASASGGDFEKAIPNGSGPTSPIILTGINDVLAWNFGGAALPSGLSVQACVWWTES